MYDLLIFLVHREATTEALNEVHIVQHLHGHSQDDQKDEESAPSFESGPFSESIPESAPESIAESLRESQSPESAQCLGLQHISEFHDHWISGRGQLHQLYTYYAHGTMDDLMVHNGQLNEKQMLQIIRQICIGLEYIHSKGIIHLDIKPSNIFVTKDHVLKIGDFGISVNTVPTKPKDNVLETDILKSPLATDPIVDSIVDPILCYGSISPGGGGEERKYHCSGDPIYIAPEVLTFGSSIKSIDFKTDMFSLGIIFLELLLDCKLPSQGAVFQNLRNDIVDFDALVRTLCYVLYVAYSVGFMFCILCFVVCTVYAL